MIEKFKAFRLSIHRGCCLNRKKNQSEIDPGLSSFDPVSVKDDPEPEDFETDDVTEDEVEPEGVELESVGDTDELKSPQSRLSRI